MLYRPMFLIHQIDRNGYRGLSERIILKVRVNRIEGAPGHTAMAL
jgi:hypothetical protein